MPVLQSGIPSRIEPQYDRTCPRHQAAVNTVFKLRAPSRDVGRKRDLARPNPRICGNAAFIGEQAITPSSLCMTLSLMRAAVPRHAIYRAKLATSCRMNDLVLRRQFLQRVHEGV